ncbi:MAG: tRNA (N(6)-L-threonylcarbamoyladenosine(37)-C(2))-methylthiotransferase MtaB [Desulfuromonadales bacterium]|nr:tRNA (N(6)-L-threonylcarbamoyladenosine(37)-C(2))-methylthiotransferase MtaB [Desulfuromonadales bacterium]
MKKKVAITTLGCKTNQFESAAIVESLEKSGYSVVSFNTIADIYIINTCTVTAKSDAESRRLIRRAKKYNQDARIIVTGCYAQISSSALEKIPDVSLVIGNNEKKRIVEFLGNQISERVIVSDIEEDKTVSSLSLESFAEHTRAFLQIQNGCNAFCTYCIIPYARGRSRSVPFDEVIKGIKLYSDHGYKEVVLTGIHLGNYGFDLSPKKSIEDILAEVEGNSLIERIRIGSIEPNEISDRLIELLASSKSLCPHLHIPLQSGSDSVLARMGRNYNSDLVKDIVTELLLKVPDISIGFDVISGFPGESDKEHNDTCSFLDEIHFAYLHVFPYSVRPGTKAADMSGHLNPEIIKARAKELRKIGENKKQNFAAKFIDRRVPVLIQSRNSHGEIMALSRNYLSVKLLDDVPSLKGKERIVRIIKVDEYGACIGCLDDFCLG